MPRRDGTGPMGMGPRIGRRMGFCNGRRPRLMNDVFSRNMMKLNSVDLNDDYPEKRYDDDPYGRNETRKWRCPDCGFEMLIPENQDGPCECPRCVAREK